MTNQINNQMWIYFAKWFSFLQFKNINRIKNRKKKEFFLGKKLIFFRKKLNFWEKKKRKKRKFKEGMFIFISKWPIFFILRLKFEVFLIFYEKNDFLQKKMVNKLKIKKNVINFCKMFSNFEIHV